MTRPFILIVLLLISIGSLWAHEPNHSYIFLRINEQSIDGRLEIGRLDFNRTLGIDLSEKLEMSEINKYKDEILNYIRAKVFFSSDVPHPVRYLTVDAMNIDEEDDNVRIYFELTDLSILPKEINISYQPFFNGSPDHKGVLIIEHHWEAGIINNHSLIAEVFTQGDNNKQLNLEDISIWKGFVAMVKLGVWHIWIGLDHILFLVALVLPAVVRRTSDQSNLETLTYTGGVDTPWRPVAKFRPAALYILKIVTFFTIAHSITLAIASLDIINLPSRYVESIIAISIALAALHNITPIFKGKEWLIAFVFGLFHGFGFASVLGEKGLGGDYIVLSLLGFNVGVELGQVAIILLVFPILFLIRTLKYYPGVLKYGSAFLIAISLHWFIERFFEVTIPIGRWINGLI